MKKILLLQHTKSRYDVLASMTASIGKALQRQGIEATLFNDWSIGPEELLRYVQDEKFDGVFSINILLSSFFPKTLQKIYLSVDSFANTPQEVSLMQEETVLFVDKCSSDLFSERNNRLAYWFPHAIAKETIEEERKRAVVPRNERPYDIVFLGSFLDYEEEVFLWKKMLRNSDVGALLSIAEKALEDETFLFQKETFHYIENTEGIVSRLKENGLLVADLVASVERYIRSIDRKNLFQTLRGHTIHVFSNEKRHYDAATDCVFHDPVPFDRMGDVCAQAKVVINSSPSIRYGFHERLFLGLASGATVLSSYTNLLPEWLEQQGSLVRYRTSTLPYIKERLFSAQGKSESREEILSWLGKEHTWDVRLRDVFSIFLK